MFGNKQRAAGNGTAKKPTIRRETVLIPVKKQQLQTSRTPQDPVRKKSQASSDRFKLSERTAARPVAKSNKRQPEAVQRALGVKRGLKRKSATPDEVHFSSDEDGESSDFGTSDSDASRKRMRSSVSSVDSNTVRRNLVASKAFEEGAGCEETDFIHGASATSGTTEGKFKNPWNQEDFVILQLQYPSKVQRERFELKWPKNETDDYKPMEDIIETVRHICQFYPPQASQETFTNEQTGFGRRFNRAWIRQSIEEFVEIVEDFNAVLLPLVRDGSVQRELAAKRALPLDLVNRILDQIYARTVSPKVETLRAYQNGSDNVYGELLARFSSEVFRQTRLDHEKVFIDLGSGVGNVVLQAALEVGCESWGIEMMKNPCDLAELQAKEFPGRTRLWGLDVGDVNLIRGDFTDNHEIGSALKRADVVLVNNQAFTPALNDKLLSMFLDLKDGCQVVSLKPFVPEGHRIAMRNIDSVANLFVQRRLEYFSGSVSWTDQSGYYYIAVKDPKPLAKFLKNSSAR